MPFLPLRDINPTRRVPWCNLGLIAANVAAFALTAAMSRQEPWILTELGFVPSRFRLDPLLEVPTAVYSMFLHGSIGHLVLNMLSLHIFGDNLEDHLGKVRYVCFYLLCGAAAVAAQFLADPSSSVPMVGASGAIGGVMGGYLLLFPRSPVLTLNLVPLLWFVVGFFPAIPAWAIVGEFVLVNLMQAVALLGQASEGGIAVFAHLGGFAAGLLGIRLFSRGADTSVRRWTGFGNRPAPAGTRGTARWRRR